MRASFKFYVKSIAIICSVILSYIGYLNIPKVNNIFYYALVILLLAFTTTLLTFNIFHDASHNSVTSSRRINQLITFFSGAFLGFSSLIWHERHVKAHHTHTNIIGKDPDLDALQGVMRFSQQHHRWHFWYRWQHLYAFPLYSVHMLKWIYVDDFVDLILLALNIKKRKTLTLTSIELVFSKIVHIILFVVIPACYFSSIFYVLENYIVIMMFRSLISSLIFQLAHISPVSIFHSNTNPLPSNRLIHQLSSGTDFAVKNSVVTALTGGLNMQIIHHLFPYISHIHYPTMQPIISSFCKEHNLPYHEYPTLRAAIAAHFSCLKILGRAP